MTVDAYPLTWPAGRERTKWPDQSRFRTTFAQARDHIVHELDLLGATELIVSTNIPLRMDGLPYANHRIPEDRGVAVYFTYKKQQMCFACDRWHSVAENMQAVAKTIEALRGIARWGTGDMMEAAFTGFKALPAPGDSNMVPWRVMLNIGPDADLEAAKAAYRKLAREAHPDRGGSEAAMRALNAAMEQARAALG